MLRTEPSFQRLLPAGANVCESTASSIVGVRCLGEQEQCHLVAKLDLPGGDIIRQGTGRRSVAFRHSFVRPTVAGPPIESVLIRR